MGRSAPDSAKRARLGPERRVFATLRTEASPVCSLRLLVLAAAFGWLACAGPQRPFSEWTYSSWYQSEGTGSKGGFEKARAHCLADAGIDDPAGVSPDSPVDDRYLACMNRRHWCTQAHHCQKVGVH